MTSATENERTTHVFKIRGMDCAEEVTLLKREVGPVVGGEERLAFDILNGRMIVKELPEGIGPQAVVRCR